MEFYTYLWLREDGTPYYVGKGKEYRGFSSDGHGVHRPNSRERIIIQHHPTEAEAFAAERFLVSYYGRLDLGTGCLRNLSDGGEGPANPAEEVRKKMREAASIPRYTDEQVIAAYTSSINYEEGAKVLGMQASPFGKRCRALGLFAKVRKYRRKITTCHPERKHYAFGLCLSCYKYEYQKEYRKLERLKETQWQTKQAC